MATTTSPSINDSSQGESLESSGGRRPGPPPLPANPPSDVSLDLADPQSPPLLPALSTPPPLPPNATPPSAAKPLEPPAEAVMEEQPFRTLLWQQLPSWLVSTVVHLALLLLLAMYTVFEQPKYEPEQLAMVAQSSTYEPALEQLEELEQTVDIMPNPNIDDLVIAPQVTEPSSRAIDASMLPSVPQIDISLGGQGTGFAEGDGDLLKGLGNSIGNSLQNRLNSANRARMVTLGGGTPASESAVDRALKWLAEHQNTDGSWSYDHRTAPKCKGRCKDPGHLGQAKIAATAMALLPFLGTGQTHRQGQYKKNIESGLYFLVRSMRVQGNNGSFFEPGGRLYGHGLASIVMCEAYGMTRDRFLHEPAQSAVNFIVMAQDPQGGGWRYVPMQAGDTSVVGWQLMALKSAHMAYLKVPTATIQKVGYFLDSVEVDEGAAYGYTGPGNGAATTAIGLLCRMYLGWERDRPALARGVAALSEQGPSLDRTGPPRNNLYYDYYATQVLHHYGGPEWQRWNVAMRDYLVASQNAQGHERGSWHFEGSDHGYAAGGRLYATAMAAMILEVYYRHMPLYTDLSTKDKFRD